MGLPQELWPTLQFVKVAYGPAGRSAGDEGAFVQLQARCSAIHIQMHIVGVVDLHLHILYIRIDLSSGQVFSDMRPEHHCNWVCHQMYAG